MGHRIHQNARIECIVQCTVYIGSTLSQDVAFQQAIRCAQKQHLAREGNPGDGTKPGRRVRSIVINYCAWKDLIGMSIGHRCDEDYLGAGRVNFTIRTANTFADLTKVSRERFGALLSA